MTPYRVVAVFLLLPFVSPCSFLITNTIPPHQNLSTSPLLSYSNHLQSRRGPDLTAHSVHHDIHFVHNLLWMNGELKTPQPFVKDDIVAIYNGEIYNADEIVEPNGESDGRSIIPSYLASGSTYARSLDGEFAVTLFDFKSNVLLLSADTFGTKPLWYSIQDSKFTIASYASAITRLGYQGTQLEPNTILKFDLDPTTKNPILGSMERFELTTFDLKQHKPHTDDFIKAFMESIRKRTQVRSRFFNVQSKIRNISTHLTSNSYDDFLLAGSEIRTVRGFILGLRFRSCRVCLGRRHQRGRQPHSEHECLQYKGRRRYANCQGKVGAHDSAH